MHAREIFPSSSRKRGKASRVCEAWAKRGNSNKWNGVISMIDELYQRERNMTKDCLCMKFKQKPIISDRKKIDFSIK